MSKACRQAAQCRKLTSKVFQYNLFITIFDLLTLVIFYAISA